MTSLTELNELEQQVQSSQEKIQDLYSSIDYADDEVQCYVTSMVDHIAQMECLQALIALENFATRNEIQLKDLKVGTKVKQLICVQTGFMKTKNVKTDYGLTLKTKKSLEFITIINIQTKKEN